MGMARVTIDGAMAELRRKLGLDQLSIRDQLILLAGGLFVTGVLVYQLLLSPYLDARTRLQSSLERKRAELTDIQRLSEEYAALQAQEGGLKALLDKRDAGFTLFAFLEKQAENAGVKEKVKYMKPSLIESDGGLRESVVEMRLEGVTLELLTEFLRLTESETNVVSVRRLSIQANSKEAGFLDAVLQIVTLVEAQ